MAKINVNKDLTNLNNGTYTGKIAKAILCKSGKVMLKIELPDGTFFVSFYDAETFGQYPFNYLFMAIDSDELEDIVNLNVKFDIWNNKSRKTGAVFSNIRKIKVVN